MSSHPRLIFAFLCKLTLLATYFGPALAATVPSVTLDSGTFLGAAAGDSNMFLGIPFAQPPVGNLRLRLPVPNAPYTGMHNATSFGLACTQHPATLQVPPSIVSNITEFLAGGGVSQSGEDCLTLNIWTPANVTKGTKLPVVVWFFGGAFQYGDSSPYDGSLIVSRSVEMNMPVIYVSLNYRLSVFGFLASKEVKKAGVGNLGLQDQRLALRWIQKYISAFNGDPSKVTIWGESAGAISVALQMVANGGNTEGLFRGAFMESGSPIPVGDITHGQRTYDMIVSEVGCSGAKDTLQCLREAPWDALVKAANKTPGPFTPQSLNFEWQPRVDGVFLADNPQTLVARGSVAKIPFVNGDCDDEGTIFALSTLNITTDAAVRGYLQSTYLPAASRSQLDKVMTLYPQDPAQGSPFGTGNQDVLSPQYKRLAAIQGDLIFQAGRRFFLSQLSSKQPAYSYINKRFKSTPGIGSAHITDILNVYGGGDLTDYLINFVNNLNPNGPGLLSWPAYSTAHPKLLEFLDGPVPLDITEDTFRTEGTTYLTGLLHAHPL